MTTYRGVCRSVSFIALLLASAAAPAQQQAPETIGTPGKKAGDVQQAKPAAAPAATAPKAQRPASAPDRTITVRSFVFTGNSVYGSDELAALVAGYTGRPITLLEIYDAADKVADFYHQNGYTLASVIPPAQKIANGEVRLEVIEGKVGKVALEGTKSYTTEQVQPYLGDIQAGQVYRVTELDEGLRMVNRLPGLNARAVLQPGAQYGTSDLIINADERRLTSSATVDNHGRENIGETRVTVAGAWNNPASIGDQFSIMYLHGEDSRLKYANVGYSLPVGRSGARASASVGQADFSLEVPGLPGVELDGESTTARVGIDWPFVLQRSNSFAGFAAVTHQTSESDLAGIPLTEEVELTVLELGATYSRVYASQAVSQALIAVAGNGQGQEREDCDGNTTNGEDCNNQAARVELDLQHLQPIVGRFDAFARVNTVWSPDPLSPVSSFAIGGPNSVRAFPASEARGDRGVFATLALRYGMTFGQVQTLFRLYGDMGEVSTIDATPGVDDDDSLSGVGVGADAYWRLGRYRVTGKIDWSQPTNNRPHSDRDDPDDDGGRLFASITAGF